MASKLRRTHAWRHSRVKQIAGTTTTQLVGVEAQLVGNEPGLESVERLMVWCRQARLRDVWEESRAWRHD